MIRALIETSLIDWDGKISMVLFFDRCNLQCPFCQNWELVMHPDRFDEIDWDVILKKLNRKRGWVDGVVLSGGEPLIYFKEVTRIARALKKMKLGVKLDTNGLLPGKLETLAQAGLVDYVAMDIKAPLDARYAAAGGKDQRSGLEGKVKQSMRFLMEGAVDYEFRTTCVPGIIDEEAIASIGAAIRGARKWALQGFVPDNAYHEELREKKYSAKELERLLEIARRYVANAELRGKR